MNKYRRKEINSIIEILSELTSRLQTLAEEEQDAFDNLPDSLQCSERGDAMQENFDDLDSAWNAVDEVIETLNGILER